MFDKCTSNIVDNTRDTHTMVYGGFTIISDFPFIKDQIYNLKLFAV